MTAAEYRMARLRPCHERGDFPATMRAAGLERCDDCGWWTNDTRRVGKLTLCGECVPPVKHPDPEQFAEGTLEHEMARNLKETR